MFGSTFGGSQPSQQQQSSQSLFGGGNTSSTSTMFGNNPSGGSSMFGNNPSVAVGGGGGGSIFGGGASSSSQPQTSFPSSSGGLFGGSGSASGTNLFGSATFGQPTTGGNLFGGQQQQQQPQQGGMFGTSNQQQSGSNLFGSTSGGGGGLFGNSSAFGTPAVTMNRQGSSLFSPSSVTAFPSGMPLQQPVKIPQYSFIGFEQAQALFRVPDATDLKFQKSSSADVQQAVQNMRIPAGFQEQLIQEQLEINENDLKLEDISRMTMANDSHIEKLVQRTKQMEQSVRVLETDLQRQTRAVTSLVEQVRETCRDAERGTRQARALLQGQTTTMTPLPSAFFTKLISELEERIADYTERMEELRVVTNGTSTEEKRRREFSAKMDFDQLLDLVKQQYKTFKVLEEAASGVHAEVSELRKQYLKGRGEEDDFALEDRIERDRQRRLVRKVENQQKQATQQQQQPGQQQQQQPPVQQQQQQPQQQQPMFGGGTPAAPSSSSFGGGGLFSPVPNASFASPIPGPSSSSSGGMFGGGMGGSSSLFSPGPPLTQQFSAEGSFGVGAGAGTPGPSAKKRSTIR